jgi:threonine dehydrogenase-like Zn-dependent dehydrogenase
MRATVMYGPGDVRVERLPDPKLEQSTDALVRVVRTCVCGSDRHPYHSTPASEQGTPMGHEFVGVVEEVGSEVADDGAALPVGMGQISSPASGRLRWAGSPGRRPRRRAA